MRVRPPLARELSGFQPYRQAVAVDPASRAITLSENLSSLATHGAEGGVIYNSYRFGFDAVYGPESTQAALYEQCARPAVLNVLQGYNATVIAYGQTGTGKTYTMEGAGEGADRAGIIPRAIEEVFASIQRDTGERCRFLVRASYLQIYNETISDLLKPGAGLGVREDRRRGVRVEGLSEWVVRSPAEVAVLLRKGAAARATGATKLNEASSRSHAIFTLTVEKATSAPGEAGLGGDAPVEGDLGAEPAATSGAPRPRQTVRVGKLNLVDLAGSERVHVTGATGQRLEESKKINQSLSTLGNVISALASEAGRRAGAGPGGAHVPYRESKLTRILEDSLGGNCVTTFLAMISPAVEAFNESLSTLKFAHRARNVRNAPTVNEDLDHRTLLRRYEQELRRLRAELQQKSKDLVDKRLLLELDAARRREQADKLAAISALERQSAEIARHKAAMAALEGRIRHMQSQLLVGGHRLEDTPAFRQLLASEQERIRARYAARLAELEAERELAAQGQAQIDRYRVLLTKQRDVMTALTQRLGERDEQVLALQTELDALRERVGGLEDRLDVKTAELLARERLDTERRAREGGEDEGEAADDNAQERRSGGRASGLDSSHASAYDALGAQTTVPSPTPPSTDTAWQIAAVRTRDLAPSPVLVDSAGDSASEAGSSLGGAPGDDDGVILVEAGQPRAPTPQASARVASKFDVAGAMQPGISNASQFEHSQPTAQLHSKIRAMQEERRALKSILESKVAAIVSEAGKSLSADKVRGYIGFYPLYFLRFWNSEKNHAYSRMNDCP